MFGGLVLAQTHGAHDLQRDLRVGLTAHRDAVAGGIAAHDLLDGLVEDAPPDRAPPDQGPVDVPQKEPPSHRGGRVYPGPSASPDGIGRMVHAAPRPACRSFG